MSAVQFTSAGKVSELVVTLAISDSTVTGVIETHTTLIVSVVCATVDDW